MDQDRPLRADCLRCTFPTGGLAADPDIAEIQLHRGLCGWCAGNDWRQRKNIEYNRAQRAAHQQEHGRFGWFSWWWGRVFR